MADQKISELSQLVAPADTDYLPIIDVSEPDANKNKRVPWASILPRSGGNLTGHVTADAGVEIDGRDVSEDGTKLDLITVTQAVDLDTIESRVNQLDAAVVLVDEWNASGGTFPGGGTAQAGDSYIVSVAGTVDGIAFSVNDRIVAITDNASTGTYAANWLKLDYTDQVLSVGGFTGAVSDSEIASAYQTAVPLISQADAEAGTAQVIESWSALRVKQAIDALASGGDLVEDTTPQLGGTLDLNGQSLSETLEAATGDETALDLSFTVNKATSGNYTALKVNATETSAPGSDNKLLDLQVGGTSKFKVSNSGNVDIEGNFRNSLARIGGSQGNLFFKEVEFTLSNSAWTRDAAIAVDAADALGVRRPTAKTNAQTFRVYGTFTDLSNYERISLITTAGDCTLSTEAAGTGTRRNILLDGANRVAKISDVSSGTDAAYETAINAIIDALEAHGLAATV